jgi:hypothetical protein
MPLTTDSDGSLSLAFPSLTPSKTQVSRERIGSEVDLMMRSARPTQAMTLIGELGLASTVFPAPENLVEGEEGGEAASALPATWCVRACVRGWPWWFVPGGVVWWLVGCLVR